MFNSKQPPPPPPTDEPKPRPDPEYPGPQSCRSQLNSLTFLSARPDSRQPRVLVCSCGRQLTVGEDWFTEIYDGTLMCWMCSVCARCGLESCVARRRLVSVGGFTICYDCLKHYGEPKVEARQLAIVEHPMKLHYRALRRTTVPPALTAAAGRDSETLSARHNVGGFLSNWWRVDRSPECRRLLRYRDYPRPDKRVPSELDPTVTQLGFYAATRVQFEQMVCPACKSKALGRSAYVAPGIAMVYHRGCFRCVCCKWPLASGIRRAGIHFAFCSCQPPLQWCTRAGCERDRREHHVTFRCRLEPFHPGGREQFDTLETAVCAVAAAPAVDATVNADRSESPPATKAATKPDKKKQQQQQQQQQPQQQLTKDDKLQRPSKGFC